MHPIACYAALRVMHNRWEYINNMNKTIPDTGVETDPMVLCDHLKPILSYLQLKLGAKVVEKKNGKGWGFGVLINKEFSVAAIENHFDLPDFIKGNQDAQMISCSQCWKNIASYKKYKNNWG